MKTKNTRRMKRAAQITTISILHKIITPIYTWYALNYMGREELLEDIERNKAWRKEFREMNTAGYFTRKQAKQIRKILKRDLDSIELRTIRIIVKEHSGIKA